MEFKSVLRCEPRVESGSCAVSFGIAQSETPSIEVSQKDDVAVNVVSLDPLDNVDQRCEPPVTVDPQGRYAPMKIIPCTDIVMTSASAVLRHPSRTKRGSKSVRTLN